MPVNKDKIMIGVVGCAGRMGNTLLHEILKNKNTDISGGTEIKGHTHIGKDLSNILKIDELNAKKIIKKKITYNSK